MEKVERVTDKLFDAIGPSVKTIAYRTYGDQLSDSDVRNMLMTYAWQAVQDNPDAPEDEVVTVANRLFRRENEYSQYLDEHQKLRKTNNRRAKLAAEMINHLSWGTVVKGLEKNRDEQVRQIGCVLPADPFNEGDALEGINIKDLLAKLLREWDHPHLALAYVLQRGFNYSVPEICNLQGVTPDNATRKRVWMHLEGALKYAKDVFAEIEPQFVGAE